jgi:hypothetical protein
VSREGVSNGRRTEARTGRRADKPDRARRSGLRRGQRLDIMRAGLQLQESPTTGRPWLPHGLRGGQPAPAPASSCPRILQSFTQCGARRRGTQLAMQDAAARQACSQRVHGRLLSAVWSPFASLCSTSDDLHSVDSDRCPGTLDTWPCSPNITHPRVEARA